MARKLDPVKTRTDILNSAFAVFAEKGYAGASIADIAEAAGAPKSLVQYHFESKEKLFQACCEDRLKGALGFLDRFIETGSEDDLRALAAHRFKTFRAEPAISRLMAWSSLEPVPIPIPAPLRERFESMAAGHLPPEKKERLTRLLFAIAAMDGWFVHHGLYSRLFGALGAPEELEAMFLDHVIALTRGSQ